MPPSIHPPEIEVVPFVPDPSWIERFLPRRPQSNDHSNFRTALSGILNSDGDILPAADSPLGRLWNILSSEDSVVEDCVGIIELDPILTTRIYRIANSAASGGNAKSIYDAVLHVGYGQVRQLVCSSGVVKKTEKLRLPAGWDKFWFRSLFVARVTERLAASFSRPSGNEYLAGLVHDIGWLLMATFFPQELDQILANPGPSLREAELAILSFTHEELSAAICARSHLPGRVVNSVLYHHQPPLIEMKQLSVQESAMFLGVLLSIGDKLADTAGLGMGPAEESLPIAEIANTPEGHWLAAFGKKIDYERILTEESARTAASFSTIFG